MLTSKHKLYFDYLIILLFLLILHSWIFSLTDTFHWKLTIKPEKNSSNPWHFWASSSSWKCVEVQSDKKMLTSQDGTREWGEQLFKTIPLDDVDEKSFQITYHWCWGCGWRKLFSKVFLVGKALSDIITLEIIVYNYVWGWYVLSMSTRLDWWSSTDLTQDTLHRMDPSDTGQQQAVRYRLHRNLVTSPPVILPTIGRQPQPATSPQVVVSHSNTGWKSVSKLPPVSRIYWCNLGGKIKIMCNTISWSG